MICVKAYYSASIRGAAGNDATAEVVQENLETGIKRGEEIQARFGTLLDLYIPHKHDRLIQILWRTGCMTDSDILMGDKEIIKTCDFMIVDGFHSTGVKVELECCHEHGIQVHFLHTDLNKNLLSLHDIINRIFHEKSNG